MTTRRKALAALAVLLGSTFLFYPPDFSRADGRGSFDLTVGRYSRLGLHQPNPVRDPSLWRTANSQTLPGSQAVKPDGPRSSLAEVWR